MTQLKRLIMRVIRPPLIFFVHLFLNQIAWVLANVLPDDRVADAFARHNIHYLRDHFYLPIPDETDMTFTRQTELAGVDIQPEAVFEVLESAILPYKAEFNAFPISKTEDPTQYYLVNGAYMAIDGNAYYGFIRHYKPRRIVEIGSGNSTLLAAAAIRKNTEEGGHKSELVCIEPYPMPMLRQHIPQLTELIEKRVQEVSLSYFEELGAGDVLFIDSSHVLRSGNDVWWEYCEILPRLKPGVLVHVHDISLPKPYPRTYFEQRLYWNEQYLLQAFLAHNHRFEVIWPGNYMMLHYPQRMEAAFTPEYHHMRAQYPLSEPSAFWMRVKGS